MKKFVLKTYWRIKITLLKFKYPATGKYERVLLSLGYTKKQLEELAQDYMHVTRNKESIYKDELYYITNN